MEKKPKYKIGDKVYALYNKSIVVGTIYSIEIKEKNIFYQTFGCDQGFWNEEELFLCAKDAIDNEITELLLEYTRVYKIENEK